MTTKVNLGLMAVTVMAVLIGTGSAWAFSGNGSGTEADPYVITDVYQLQEMQNDLGAYYVLGNDIDASGTVSWNGGAGFEPIGNDIDYFTGSFDGLEHTITSMYINRPSTTAIGLISFAENAEIKNVGLADVDITGSSGIGALVYHNYDSKVINCWSSGNVKSTFVGANSGGTGGLVGVNLYGGFVSKCHSSVNVTGNDAWQYGGLVGNNIRGSIIVDCYATGDVKGTHKVGGLVGDNMHGALGGYVKRCYSTGKVTGSGGGLIGYNWESGITYDSYWDTQTSGKSSSKGGTPKDTDQMMQQATFVNWDFDDIWEIDEGQSYPYFFEPRILEGLEITGPNEVAENSQVQYKAIAVYDNNSTKDVAAIVDWSVEPNSNCSIAAGLLTTEMVDLPEDVTITAQYSEDPNTKIAQKDVSILAICPSGSALEFDGVNDYVEVPDAEDLYFGVSDFTVALWINYNSLSGDHIVLIEKYTEFGGGCGWSFAKLSNDYDHALRFGVTDPIRSFDVYPSVTTGTWYHAVVNRSGDLFTIFWDGKAIGSKTFSVNVNCTMPLKIGRREDSRGFFMNGLIDEVVLFNRALSAEEIQVLMHTKPDNNEPNLVAYWDFDEVEGQVAYDKSGNGNDGVLGSSLDPDDSDPEWVDSDAPVGICTMKELFERNINQALDIKLNILEQLEEALGKETYSGAIFE
jgi:hypothetical protein